MALVPTVCDVLFFHSIDRAAYERLITLGANQQVARNAVALLMWLEQGDLEVLHSLANVSSVTALQVAFEANSILCCLRENAMLPNIPLLSSLSKDINARYFMFNQDLLVRGVKDILDGVGVLIFNDQLQAQLHRYKIGLNGGLLPAELAAPFSFYPMSVPEDYRSMFITFSKGLHVDREDIFNYFNQKWGDCVVRVLMEKTSQGVNPMYGRIIFKSKAHVSLLLNGENLVKLAINNCNLWLRKYIPRATINPHPHHQ